ncbi:MAG: DMT family transporter [Burkholderiales bacterium]|nr:DMT family transporter [Burkholderiales bacterium]
MIPAVVAASAFACADVIGKLALLDGTGVLSLATFRSWIGLALLAAWLRLDAPAARLDPGARWIALGIGVLFTGNVYWLFKSFESVEVPVAILTYFAYPLLTGLAAAACGIERLSGRGAAAAAAAFLGLALMLGAHPGGLALAGVLAALAAACCRVVMLLVMRAWLGGVDTRLVTWHSLLASTALFTLLSLAAWSWQGPASASGWAALIALGVTTTIGMLGVFASTARVGPFRTALLMNLEPLLAAIGSALFLGEVLTPLQAAGGALMIAALAWFQWKR